MVTSLTTGKTLALRRQEELVAALMNYVAGHTAKISDFNEGSIVRSIIEGVSQELFRQNVTFAQQVSEAIRESVRSAFGLPFQTKKKAYGTVTFYRRMLSAPTLVAGTYSDTYGKLSSTVIGIGKTNSGVDDPYDDLDTSTSPNETSNLSLSTDYYYAVCPIFCGEGLQYTVTGTTVSAVAVDTNNTSGFGYKTGDVVTINAGNHNATVSVIVDNATRLVTGGTIVSGGSGYTNNTKYQTIGSPIHCVGIGSNILKITSSAVAQANKFTIKNVMGAGRFLVFRSTSPYMINSTCWEVKNPYASSLKATRESTGVFYVRDNGIGLQSGLVLTYTQVSGAITSVTVSNSGKGYKSGTIISVSSPTSTVPARFVIYTKNSLGIISGTMSKRQGEIEDIFLISGGAGFSSGQTLEITVENDHNVTFPGTTWNWAVAAKNRILMGDGTGFVGIGNSAFATTTAPVSTLEKKGFLQWQPVSAADQGAAVTGYKIWRTPFALSKKMVGGFTIEGMTLSNTTGFLDNGVYWYSVSAIYSDADESVATTPISFIVTSGSYVRKARISWEIVPDAVGYRVYRASDSDMTENLRCVDIESSSIAILIDNGTIFASGIQPRRWTNLTLVNNNLTTKTDNKWSYLDDGTGGTVSDSYYNGDAALFNETLLLNPTASATSGSIVIGAGTRAQVPGTSKTYEVAHETTISENAQSANVTMMALSAGTLYNTEANTITLLPSPIFGVDSITNENKIKNGVDQETEEQWQNRFSAILDGLSRGTSSSIEYGAKTAAILDANKLVTEYVTRAIVRDFGQNDVIVNVHNGTENGTSQALVNKCQKVINGYVDDDGVMHAGYKPAGIPVTVYAAGVVKQNVYVDISTYGNISSYNLSKAVQNEIVSYFDGLDISDGLVPPTIIGYSNNTGGYSYQYQVVAIDTIGGKSLPSNTLLIPNCLEIPDNVIQWNAASTDSGYPEILEYEILRRSDDNPVWSLVEKITSADYLSNGILTYNDTSTISTQYTFISPQRVMFQKSKVIQRIMTVPGVASAKVYFDPMSRYIKNTDRLGSGLLMTVTIDIVSETVSAMSISSAGIRYQPGDMLIIPGYDADYGLPAIFMVLGVNSVTGAVTSFKIISHGLGYSSVSNPVAAAWLVPNEPEFIIPIPGNILVPGVISVQ